MANPIPVIATGKVFQTYLDAARCNLANMLQLATALKDAEFAHEAQCMLESFDEAAADALELIAEANANSGAFDGGELFWRESIYVENAGLAA